MIESLHPPKHSQALCFALGVVQLRKDPCKFAIDEQGLWTHKPLRQLQDPHFSWPRGRTYQPSRRAENPQKP